MYERREVLRLGAGVTAAGAALGLLGQQAAVAAPSPQAPPAPPSTGPAPDRAAWRELARALRPGAALYRPEQHGYGELADPDNLRYAHVRPAGIVACATTSDVQAAVRWARKHGVPLVPRSGGHNYAGYSTTPGLLVHLRRLDSLAPRGELLHVGGGATNSDVYAARAWNLYFPGGRCPDVGVAGLTLGGGLGFNDRKWGLTCDRLVSTDVVLADGTLVRASNRENTDLFWACRGGAGGNFGINTGFSFRPVSVASQVATVFDLTFAPADGVRVAQAVQEALAADHAGDLDVRLAFVSSGEVETRTARSGAHAAHGTASVSLLGQYLGTEDQLRRVLAPVLGSRRARPTKSFIEQRHFWDAQERLMAAPEKNAMASKSLVPHGWLDQDTVAEIVEWTRGWQPGGPGDLAYVTLFAMGGRSAEPGVDETAFPHREATFVIDIGTHWPPRTDPKAVRHLLRQTGTLHRTLSRRLRTSAAYVNFPDGDLADWQRAYYGANYNRLVAVKHRWDPHRTFHYPQAVGTA